LEVLCDASGRRGNLRRFRISRASHFEQRREKVIKRLKFSRKIIQEKILLSTKPKGKRLNDSGRDSQGL
jgi:hypothetical protein